MQPLQLDLQNSQITGEDRATALSMHAVVLESPKAERNTRHDF